MEAACWCPLCVTVSIYRVGDITGHLGHLERGPIWLEKCKMQPSRICLGSNVSFKKKKSYCLVVVNGLLFWCGASGIAQIGTARVNARSKAGRLLMKGPYVSIKYHCELEGFYFSPLIVLLTVHTVSLTFLTTLLAPNKKGWERGGGKEEGAGGRGPSLSLNQDFTQMPCMAVASDSARGRQCSFKGLL